MLKFLLDEHISYDVAAGLRRKNRYLVVHCLAAWEKGSHLGLDDAALLEKAATQGLTLVTYNRRTIPPLLKAWAQEDRTHAGLIFVDEKTLAPDDIGGMVRALLNLFVETGYWNWTNRVCFLRRG